MNLRLSTGAGRGCTVVRAGGDIDMATGPQLHDAIRDVVDGGARRVVLDFADVPFMDSTGLGVLVDAVKLLQDRGGRLGVAAAQKPVRYVLEISAVDQVVGLYETVAAAEDGMPPAGS